VPPVAFSLVQSPAGDLEAWAPVSSAIADLDEAIQSVVLSFASLQVALAAVAPYPDLSSLALPVGQSKLTVNSLPDAVVVRLGAILGCNSLPPLACTSSVFAGLKEIRLLPRPKIPPQPQVRPSPKTRNQRRRAAAQATQVASPQVQATTEKIVEVPQVQNAEKIFEVPQVQNAVKIVDVPQVNVTTEKIVEVLQVQNAGKSFEVPQVQNSEKIVEVPQVCATAGKIFEVPQVRATAEKTVDVPQVRATAEKIVEVPQVQNTDKTVEVPQVGATAEKIVDVPQVRATAEKIVEVPQDLSFNHELEMPQETRDTFLKWVRALFLAQIEAQAGLNSDVGKQLADAVHRCQMLNFEC